MQLKVETTDQAKHKTTGTIKYLRLLFIIILSVLGSSSAFSQNTAKSAVIAPKTIYFFSGLGADSLPFANLKLPGYRRVYINWIPPLPGETLQQYAGRISSQITTTDPYIVGLSFGGILAVEVSKQIPVSKMALISSARTHNDLNKVQNFFMRMGLYRIIPGGLLRHTNFLTHMYFGANTEKDKKALMKLLKDTDIPLFRWGLKSIAHWDNREPPERTIQIHGTADKVIGYRRQHPDYSIAGGGHLMIINKADTISKIILNYFNN